jgi:hypothetical protein
VVVEAVTRSAAPAWGSVQLCYGSASKFHAPKIWRPYGQRQSFVARTRCGMRLGIAKRGARRGVRDELGTTRGARGQQRREPGALVARRRRVHGALLCRPGRDAGSAGELGCSNRRSGALSGRVGRVVAMSVGVSGQLISLFRPGKAQYMLAFTVQTCSTVTAPTASMPCHRNSSHSARPPAEREGHRGPQAHDI